MKKILALVIIIGLTAAAFALDTTATAPANVSNVLNTQEAEQTAAATEAGKYERKAVTFLNALWLMDKSVRGMPGEYVSYTLEKIKQKIEMPRFDYNPLPEALIADFVSKANAQEEITIDNLAKLMDETIVPKILQIVDLQKELRAQNYTTEAQRNSFYATKAKEFGFTDVEIAKVMNASFIYLPVAKSYVGVSSGGQYKMMMDVGIIWYRISTKGEKAQAKLVVKNITTSMGFAKEKNSLGLDQTYIYDGKAVDCKEFAFRSCVKNAARNLLVATQEMPEFRLSGQVVEVDGGKVGFDLGKKEGLCLDDKYKIVEFEESADGSVKQTEGGWVMVSMVADSNSKEGYKSKAKLISGAPMTGAVLSEYPRIPIDVALKFRTYPGMKDSDDSAMTSGGVGGQIDARYNIGRALGTNQLFLGVGYGFGSSSGDNDVSASNTNIDILLMKRAYVGRFTLGLEGGFSIVNSTVEYSSTSLWGTYNFTWDMSGTGFFVGGNIGMALSPALNVEASLRYETATLTYSGLGDNKMSGLGIHIGLTWSPPALPFDPVDMIRGRAGL